MARLILSHRARVVLSLTLVVAAVFFLIRHSYNARYPYGWSHCCDKQLWFALEEYALTHGGVFPAGGDSSEASLSLLYPAADANLLRGKTVPLDAVETILSRGGRLGPETCGWHYVDGLRFDDDPRLALFWGKVPLGHNGERIDPASYYVWFVNGSHEDIIPSQWQAFLEEQERLRIELKIDERREAKGSAAERDLSEALQ